MQAPTFAPVLLSGRLSVARLPAHLTPNDMRPLVRLVCLLIATASPAGAAFAQGEVAVHVRYSDAADAFEILDQASAWWPGFVEPAYRAFWADSLGVTPADSVLFDAYSRLRTRHFDRTGQENGDPRTGPDGLFTARAALTADPVAHAFYQSETVEEALGRLAGVLEPGEVAFLRAFYGHFEARLAPLLAETRQAVAPSLAATAATLDTPEVRSYLGHIGRLFGVEEPVAYTALYVWWPNEELVRASPSGPFLLLRTRPRPGETMNSADVVAHEAVHVLAAQQPEAQKRAVTDAVLAECPGVLDRTRRLGVIEEPLATALGNIEFRRRFQPARFRWGRRWYGQPWVDVYARVLHPAVVEALDAGRGVDERLVADLSALCGAVVALGSAE